MSHIHTDSIAIDGCFFFLQNAARLAAVMRIGVSGVRDIGVGAQARTLFNVSSDSLFCSCWLFQGANRFALIVHVDVYSVPIKHDFSFIVELRRICADIMADLTVFLFCRFRLDSTRVWHVRS